MPKGLGTLAMDSAHLRRIGNGRSYLPHGWKVDPHSSDRRNTADQSHGDQELDASSRLSPKALS